MSAIYLGQLYITNKINPTSNEGERETLHLLTHHTVTTVLWPGLLPRSRQGKRAVEAWFPLSLSDPALFTAFVYGALCHQRVQCLTQADPRSTFSEKQEKALQNVEMKAIELINKAMQDPSRRLSDAVVLSIVCMAHHNPMDATTREQRPTPFKAPLKDLQWLNIYGCLPPNMIHIHGLIQLLSMRGGLKDIKTYGLAATLSLLVLPKLLIDYSVIADNPQALIYLPLACSASNQDSNSGQ